MRAIKLASLVLVLFVSLCGFQTQAEAHTGFFLGFSYYHPAYHYYPYFYGGPYWSPYSYYGYGYYAPYYYRSYGGAYYNGYGEIRLEVKPKTAKVYVDGDYVGIVDDFDGWAQRLNVEPGRHRVVIREAGFAPYAETIRVLPGRDYHIKFQMQPGQDAIQEQDMRLQGEDRRYDNRQNYDYRNRNNQREPHQDQERDQGQYQNPDRSEREEPPPENQQFERNTKTLVLQVQPSDATIYIDSNYYGTAESGEVQVMLPKGEHKIEVVRPGYESFTKDIRVDDNSNDKIVINLQKK